MPKNEENEEKYYQILQ